MTFTQPVSDILITARERARRLSRRVLQGGLALGLVGMLSAGIQNAYSSLQGSDLFRLEEIAVVGNRLLTEREVIDRTGLSQGGNLFEADLRAATDSLSAHPLVRKVLLHRQPPASLLISLEERVPVALVSRFDGVCGLDAEGTCFPLPTAPFDLPVITSAERLADASETPSGSRPARRLARFLETIRTAQPDLWNDISELHVLTPNEGKLILVGDALEILVRFSEPDVVARNLSSFFHASGALTGVAYLDLRFENQVVVGRL